MSEIIKDNQLIAQEETEEETESTKDIVKKLGGEKNIVSQVTNEFELCYEFMRPKITEWLRRLKIYNNQKRDASKIGDPLLFTVFQTLFASLYEDKLSVEFLPSEFGDTETAENQNVLAKYDYRKMEKDELDYEWDWDTMFFGRGLVSLQEFDRNRKMPIPEVIDICTFLRDPRAKSMNGNLKGYGSARFWGREISATKYELEKNKEYFNLDKLKTGKELRSLLSQAKQSRNFAQGTADTPTSKEDNLKENAEYALTEWNTHFNGEKYLVTLGNSKTQLIRVTKLKKERWQIIERSLFPSSGDWDGVSVPDLVEDKQRARAKLANLGLESAIADVFPMYIFDENRIKNKADLNFGYNKFVRSDGPPGDAIIPMNKPIIHSHVSWIMDLMDQSAQRALATPETQQGVTSDAKKTLGEIELVSSKVDTRYSLAAKIFGWSEKRFWREWYSLYKEHFDKSIGEKVIRLSGVWGNEFRPLTKDNIISNIDPDIEIESKKVAEVEKVRQRNSLINYLGLISQDPTVNLRFAFKDLAKLYNFSPDKIKILFPETVDEIEAEKENQVIENKKMPKVEIRQDHQTHIMIHGKLNDSKIRDEHIEMHKYAMYLQRENQALFQQEQAQPQTQKEPIQTKLEPEPQAQTNIRQTTPIPQAYEPK